MSVADLVTNLVGAGRALMQARRAWANAAEVTGPLVVDPQFRGHWTEALLGSMAAITAVEALEGAAAQLASAGTQHEEVAQRARALAQAMRVRLAWTAARQEREFGRFADEIAAVVDDIEALQIQENQSPGPQRAV